MIKLNQISKYYGTIKLLEKFSYTIEDGQTICVLGRSGCGKSTLLKVMALIIKPDEGELVIDGKKVDQISNREIEVIREQKIAYSFQEPLLIPYMTALENLTEVLGIKKDKAIEILNKLGLSNRLNHTPSKLSVGEKKRVDIARAFLKRSKILIADEPFSNLDPTTSLSIVDLLRMHTKNGGALVYSTVEPSDTKFADDVITF